MERGVAPSVKSSALPHSTCGASHTPRRRFLLSGSSPWLIARRHANSLASASGELGRHEEPERPVVVVRSQASLLAAPPAASSASTGSIGGEVPQDRAAQQAPPHLVATHSVVALAAAWDQLAPRLPLQTGMGLGSELILNALKLALAANSGSSSYSAGGGGGSSSSSSYVPPAARALGVALRLADLASAGLPLDAEAVAAGILAEALCRAGGEQQHGSSSVADAVQAAHSLQLVEQRVGADVAHLVHDVLRVRALPSRVDLYDDEAASALRELCLSFYDHRATAVEVACRMEGLAALAASRAPKYECQVAALEALQIYAPMAHALGMGRLAAQLEDCCFQLLFPESYARTAAWLRSGSGAGHDTLERCQAAIRAAVLGQPRFHSLAGGLVVAGRTKSLFSTLKKLLRLGETARGGRSRAEIYDLMGVRLIVQPRRDLPDQEAEEAAAQACYLVRDAVHALYEPIPGRTKDYIAAPKENGYQSLHTTVLVSGDTVTVSTGEECEGEQGGEGCGADVSGTTSHLELQIRTQAMHERAEVGQAAHAAYKGGLAARQARQLRAWTEATQRPLLPAVAAAAEGHSQAQGQQSGEGLAGEGRPGPLPPQLPAGEVLFRHLDRNGDGRLSLGELREALRELGVQDGEQAAAEELMALVDTDDDGSIDLQEFLVFHQKAGLLRAISEVDHETAEQLEHQVHTAAAPASSSSSSSSSSSTCSAVAGPKLASSGASPAQQRLPSLLAGRLRLRPASPWAAARRGLLHWAAHNMAATANAMHVNSSGGSGGGKQHRDVAAQSWQQPQRPGGRIVSTAVTTDVLSSSASSASLSSSIDWEQGQPEPAAAVNGSAAQQAQHVQHAQQQAGAEEQAQQQQPNGTASNSIAQHQPAEALGSAEPHAVAPAQLETPARELSSANGNGSSSSSSRPRGGSPVPGAGRALSAAMRPFLRVWQRNRPLPAAADWSLVPAPGNSQQLVGPVGQQVPAISLPQQGPCIVGAVRDRDCDVLLDVPTVSGRHARLWVKRRPGANSSQLFVTDVGSTNGTWVNRYRIRPFTDVMLYPGDLVHFAQPDVGFIVQVGPSASPAAAAAAAAPADAARAVGGAAAAAAAAAGEVLTSASIGPALCGDLAPLPAAVASALALASALEAAAAQSGVFPPPAGSTEALGGAEGVGQRARELIAAEEFVGARMLLLGEVMRRPQDGGLWAQLANLERNMAKHASRENAAAGPPSVGTARAFYGAAVACYTLAQQQAAAPAAAAEECGSPAVAAVAAAAAAGAAGAAAGAPACVLAAPSQGLVRALSSWAQMEYSVSNDRAGRALFRQAIRHAQELQPQPSGGEDASKGSAAEGNGASAGEGAAAAVNGAAATAVNGAAAAASEGASEAASECAVDLPRLLFTFAHKEWKRGDATLAAQLAQQALRLQPDNHFVLALLAGIKQEAGQLHAARQLYQRALQAQPGFVSGLQSWARLEAGAGQLRRARQLFERALLLDPGNPFVLQAWAVAEGRQGHVAEARQLFARCLEADPGCRVAWHAWAKLEEQQGSSRQARELYGRVLALDPHNAPALSALGRLERLAGNNEEAERLLTAALRREPRMPSALRELGLLRRAQGEEEEAARLEQQAERVNAFRRDQVQAAALGKTRWSPKKGGQPAGREQKQRQRQGQQGRRRGSRSSGSQ